MKYLALVYYSEEEMTQLSQSAWDEHNRECMAFVDEISSSGHFIDGRPLQPKNTATTVRVRDGKMATTDGPFAETKEQLAGFYLLEARDLNEAISLAARIPPARHGSIEVRPIRELKDEGNQHYTKA